MTIDDQVKDRLRRSDGDNGDLWAEVCDAADLTLDRGVPVQGQRHLIASWSGVCTGVRILVGRLRGENKTLRRMISERDAVINELNAKLIAASGTSHGQDKENIALRVHNTMNDRSDVSDDLKSVIMQEIRA